MAVDSFQDIEFQKHHAALEWILDPEEQRSKGIVSNDSETICFPTKENDKVRS